MAKDIFNSKKWFNSMDSVTEIGTVNEAVNPDVHRSVNGFIKKMANKYNYPLQSAVNAIMSVLRSQKYKVESVNEERLNEGNSYFDLKQQYYELSDNIEFGGILSTLQDIKKKKDTDQFEKIGGIDRELRLWSDIQKLYNKSKLGKIL
jgi:hypothetical protein|tara:strand:- start:473 stop:916 length:444 start_codon:yes stop_codon:yes gene_type:complete